MRMRLNYRSSRKSCIIQLWLKMLFFIHIKKTLSSTSFHFQQIENATLIEMNISHNFPRNFFIISHFPRAKFYELTSVIRYCVKEKILFFLFQSLIFTLYNNKAQVGRISSEYCTIQVFPFQLTTLTICTSDSTSQRRKLKQSSSPFVFSGNLWCEKGMGGGGQKGRRRGS